MPADVIPLSVFLAPSTCTLAPAYTLESIASRCRNDGATLILGSSRGVELVSFQVPTAAMRPVARDCSGSYLKSRQSAAIVSGTVAFGGLYHRRIPLATFDVDSHGANSFAGGLIGSIDLLEDQLVELTSFHVAWNEN